MSSRSNRNDQQLNRACGSNVPKNSTSLSSTLGHHRSQEASIDRGEQQEHQIKLLVHQSIAAASACASASSPVIVASTTTAATGTITSTSSTYSCSSSSPSSCNLCTGNGNNNGNNSNFHRARRRLHVPPVGQSKASNSMAQIADDNNGYHEVKNLHHHHHHHYHATQVAQQEQNEEKKERLNATAVSDVDSILAQSCRDICNCDYKNASSSKCNDITRDKYVICKQHSKYADEEDGVNHHNVPSNDTLDIKSKCIQHKSLFTETSVATDALGMMDPCHGAQCPQDSNMKVKCNLTNESVVSNVKNINNSGNVSSNITEGVSFTPSPEILFLVREHAKTLKTLSCISKRLEQLENKVCDIQRTVNNTNTMQLSCTSSSSSSNIQCNSAHCADVHCKVRGKCAHNDGGDAITASGSKKHLGNNGILSDDSGGEYSRTTNGTVADEDELISLLDQIAKCSQQIRDTQANQVAAANHYLAMSNANSLQGTSKESSQGTLVSDTRQHSTLLPHVNTVGMSSHPYICSTSNSVSSHQQQRHQVHSSHDMTSSSSPIASCSISRHNSNSSARMLSASGGVLPHKHVSDACNMRGGSVDHHQHQHQHHHHAQMSASSSNDNLVHNLTASTSALHMLDSPGYGHSSGTRVHRNNSSPLSALLFDPNISNVLTNLQDELTNDTSTIVSYNNSSSFLNPLVASSRRYTVGDIATFNYHDNNGTTGATGFTHAGGVHVDTVDHTAGVFNQQQVNHPLHRSSVFNNHTMCHASSSSSPVHAKNNSYQVNASPSTCSSSSSPSAASVNRSRMPTIPSQQQHVSPAFLSTPSSHLVHTSQQDPQQPPPQQQPRQVPAACPPQQSNNPFTSVNLRRQSNDNSAYNLRVDVEGSDIATVASVNDDNNGKKNRSSGVNRVSSSSSTSSTSSSSSSSSVTMKNNSHLNMLKIDHARRFVQQRERDECKIACDLADEWLAKYSSPGIACNSGAGGGTDTAPSIATVTSVTAVVTTTTATVTNSTCSLTSSNGATAIAAAASSLRGRHQHHPSSSSHHTASS